MGKEEGEKMERGRREEMGTCRREGTGRKREVYVGGRNAKRR